MGQLDLADVHEVHNSERLSFRGCRRRWNWAFQERWYPPLTAKPLEFGVAYHLAMETYYDPELWHGNFDAEALGSDADISEVQALNQLAAVGAFVGKCEEQRQGYLKHLTGIGETAMFSGEVKADYDERVQLGIGMLKYYFEEVAPKLDGRITPTKTEIGFKVPILKPDFYERMANGEMKAQNLWDISELVKDQDFLTKWQLRCNAPQCAERHVPNAPVVFAGRIDLLLTDDHGDLWILDWKTAARLAVDREEFLMTDNAITAYCWALFMCGVATRGFLYHEQKKGFPQPPKENATTRKGCRFSVNKQQDTDYDTFVAHVQEFDRTAYEAGYYDEFIAYLKAEGIKFYARYEVHRSTTELFNSGYYIAQEAADMTDPRLRIYPQPGRFSCTSCAFRQPCLGQTAGEDYLYTLSTMFEKRDHYWIREEPSTDKKSGE
jgi:hypothetical protein